MDESVLPWITGLAAVGVGAGLWLLVRGMGGYRTAARIGDTGTSTIAWLAAGEVRVSGVIEAAELTLVSPLQSQPCVYYRASVSGEDDARDPLSGFEEERAVGFRIRDASGDIRVFPREARWDAPVCFDERTDTLGDEPSGLDLRDGSAFAPAEVDRATAIAALLTVQRPREDGDPRLQVPGRGQRRYQEARLAVGDAVTIIGRALPFSDLADPAEADIADDSAIAADDPEIAANLAEAQAAGILTDPATAWGNAAIPGFGIGRPTRAPTLDQAALRPALGSADDAERAERRFAIAPETLVLASAPDVPLLIAAGTPGVAVERQQDRFVVGLFGAILAIGSAVVLAVGLGGSAR